MSAQPVNALELRALEQRNQIHRMADELKGKISETKERLEERLDVTKIVREHLFAVAMAIGAATLLIGAMVARRFER
jgi:demethoxyubiquinone hydroxylase (CLK1/Coq7/Cat5 family)